MKNILLAILICTSIFVSAQNTITWSAGTNIAASSYDNLHPRMVTEGSGNPIIIWGRMSDESVFISRWNGSAFTTPVKVNPSWLTVATQTWMGPDIAAKGDTVYVVMKQTPEDTGHIYIVASIDGGATFNNPVQVDLIADSVSRFPTVTVDANGNPIVGFMKFDPGFGDARWVVTASDDLGNTFSPDVLASGWSGAGATVCDCCPGSIVSSGNTVAMLYRDNLSNIRDSWAGISTDGGNSFTQGLSIDQNNWMLMMCPSSGPDGVVIGDTLYTTFMNGAGGMNMTYFNKSSLTSLTGSAGIPLTGMVMGLNSQNYPRIASAGNALAVVWKQNVSGSDQLVLRFTNNVSIGLPAGYDTVDLNDVTNSDVTMTDGEIFVVWEDDNSGTVKYRKGTFTPATGMEEMIKQNLFFASPTLISNFLNIELTESGNASIFVTNAIGQEIFSKQVSKPEKRIQVNTSEWSDGIYFITLQTGTSSSTQKIYKAN